MRGILLSCLVDDGGGECFTFGHWKLIQKGELLWCLDVCSPSLSPDIRRSTNKIKSGFLVFEVFLWAVTFARYILQYKHCPNTLKEKFEMFSHLAGFGLMPCGRNKKKVEDIEIAWLSFLE